MVLASLLVASLLGLALIKKVLLHHRQVQVAGQQQQSFWLAEAGTQRAVQRLAESPDYHGEEWVIPADVLGAARPATVIIEVTNSDEYPQTRQIGVEARFPDDPIRRTIYRRTLPFHADP